MNSYAEKSGMKDSNFANPSGLTDENHYSTAYDMALLTSVAIKNPVFRKICSTESAVIDFGTPEVSRTLTNHNRLLREYEGVFGVKTGYTKASGRCLVTACERNGVTLIAVTLNAYDDWNDHKKLYNFGFSLYDNESLQVELHNISIPVVCADIKCVSVETAFQPEFRTNGSYKSEIYIEQFLYPPVKKGDIVGCVIFYDKKENVIEEIPLVSLDSATSLYKEVKEKTSFFQRLKKFIERLSI
jgi:D-alanyl-D-alanine carboxypeptidase/D-alanyl-D-alanine carboxypeptidase (penicillin-binding protein 5/6)